MNIINALEAKLNSPNRKNYFYLYTIVFIVMISIVLSWFYLNEKSLIWGGGGKGDGVDQHFPALVYFGTYLRTIFFNLIHFRFQIPLWDHSLGYGSDILTTLHYYVIGDPLNLLSFFVPQRHSELLYDFLMIARFYLAGFAFSLYCFRMRQKGLPILIGVLIFVFCGYGMVVLHTPYFVNPMIYLPLLLIGVEKIFNNEKPYLFICMVFISLLSNFFLFYVLSCMILIYAAVRVFWVVKDDKIKNAFKWLGKFSIYYFVGMLMACIIFIPNLIALLNSVRGNVSYPIDLFYNLGYYKEFLFSLITIHGGFFLDYFYWLKLGYSALALLAIVLIFTKTTTPPNPTLPRQGEGNKDMQFHLPPGGEGTCEARGLGGSFLQLKIGFIILTIFALLPIGGMIFTGLSYVTNRWVWAYSFVIAFICVLMIPYLINLKKKEILALSIFSILYFVLCIGSSSTRFSFYIIPCIFLIAFVGLILFINKAKMKSFTAYILLLILVMANISYNAYNLYSPNKSNYIGYFTDSGTAIKLLTSNGQMSVSKLNDTSFNRIEENPFYQRSIENASMLTRFKSTAYYFSLANPYIFKFMEEVEHYTHRDFQYDGLDGRAMLETLASVKYFIVANGREMFIPYGFDKKVGSYLGFDGVTYNAYQNENTLPLGFTYSSYISANEYANLTAIQKQQVLLQTVVLEENLPAGFKVAKNLNFNDKRIKAELVKMDNAGIQNGRLIVGYGGSMTLAIKSIPNTETYIRFNNFAHEGGNIDTFINVVLPDVSKTFYVSSPYLYSFVGKKNFILNLGYSTKERNTITISFTKAATFSFTDIEVISLPIGTDYQKQVLALKENVLENVELLNNKVKGTINLKENKILHLTIPYSKGWKATVNGKKAKLLQANTMYMALPLQAGNHEIQLKYITPGLKLGILLSLIGWLMFAGIIFFSPSPLRGRDYEVEG